MGFQSKLKAFLKDNFLIKLLKRIKLHPLNDISLYDLINILFKGLSNEVFGMRVGAVSWAFFFSLFPFLLFLFSILPYAPLYEEIRNLLFSEFIPRILPPRITEEVIPYINETAGGRGPKTWGYFFILLTIILSSNGIAVLIKGFSISHDKYTKKRKEINKRLVSLVLTIFFVVFIIAQLILTYYSNFIWQYIEKNNTFLEAPKMVNVLNFTSASLFYFTSLALLYYYGANIKQRFRHIAPGAFMATILFFVSLLGFQFYIQKLNKLDVFYGSVGLVMIMMIFVYINVLLIMVGFEINAAIHYAKKIDFEEED